MSRLIATAAIRGAHGVVQEAERSLQEALQAHGAAQPVAFPNTAYYLPVIFGYTGRKVERLGDLVPVMELARSMLTEVPRDRLWLPYLGETLDAGVATLLAEETIEAVRFVNGEQPEMLELAGLAAPQAVLRFSIVANT